MEKEQIWSFPLKNRRLKGDGTDNIPDGEIYTAPVKDSVNGVITFNTVSVQQGYAFQNIKLHIKNGKIIEANANDTERINRILDTDEGKIYWRIRVGF